MVKKIISEKSGSKNKMPVKKKRKRKPTAKKILRNFILIWLLYFLIISIETINYIHLNQLKNKILQYQHKTQEVTQEYNRILQQNKVIMLKLAVLNTKNKTQDLVIESIAQEIKENTDLQDIYAKGFRELKSEIKLVKDIDRVRYRQKTISRNIKRRK